MRRQTQKQLIREILIEVRNIGAEDRISALEKALRDMKDASQQHSLMRKLDALISHLGLDYVEEHKFLKK